METLHKVNCCGICKHQVTTCDPDCWPKTWCNQTGAFEALESFKPEYRNFMGDGLEGYKQFDAFRTAVETAQEPYSVADYNICKLFEPKL